jgi:hypothetical protein
LLPDGRDDVRQQVGRERRNGGQRDAAGIRILVVSGDLPDFVDVLQDLLRLGDDLLADVRQQHLLVVALDEDNAQFVLELLDLCAQGRLADETFEVSQIHTDKKSLYIKDRSRDGLRRPTRSCRESLALIVAETIVPGSGGAAFNCSRI